VIVADHLRQHVRATEGITRTVTEVVLSTLFER